MAERSIAALKYPASFFHGLARFFMRRMLPATAWLVSITLMAGVAATSWYLGDQAAVTVAKIAIVPLYLLATKGLRAYFQNSSQEDPDFKAVARFQFSDAALLAAFVVVVAAHANSAASRMVMDFIWITALVGGTLTVATWLRQKRQNNAK